VHRAMEIMGVRAAIRAGTEIQALAMATPASRAYMKEFGQGVRHALSVRDKSFGDYREREKKE
ncbi:MAG: enoyl-CoA hydratase, partial [Terriglobia bacterium]